mgnify:CR=1 FL=1
MRNVGSSVTIIASCPICGGTMRGDTQSFMINETTTKTSALPHSDETSIHTRHVMELQVDIEDAVWDHNVSQCGRVRAIIAIAGSAGSVHAAMTQTREAVEQVHQAINSLHEMTRQGRTGAGP